MSTRSSAIQTRKIDTRQVATMGMLTALGVLAAFFELPLIPAAPFLKYDAADIPILIGALIYGPATGFIMTVGVSLLQSLLHGAGGPIGFVMHVVATGAMAIMVGNLYKRIGHRTIKSAVFPLFCGVLTMTAVMVGMNLLLTPIYMGVPRDVVVGMLVPAIIPFNLLKAGINSVVTCLVYRAVEKLAVR